MAVGDVRQACEAFIAVDVVLAPQEVLVSRDLGEELPDQPFALPVEAYVVAEPHERPFDERIGRLAVQRRDVCPSASFHKGANILKRADSFCRECHNHTPMM